MSNSAWCDLNSKSDFLELHDKCPNPKCNCQKLITSTPKQFQLEGNGLKNTIEKTSKGTQTAANKFLKPAIIAMAPFIGMAVLGQNKKSKGQISDD